ncbi:hypothetical protein PMAYCL1PPCAC_16324, partial [Pristionchus mayeri]
LPAYWFFISEPFHSYFYRTTLSVSIISNIMLIFAIRKSEGIQMGYYRYLLFSFAVWDMISSLSHSLVPPIVHMTERGFFFIPKHAMELRSENGSKQILTFRIHSIQHFWVKSWSFSME